jgi:uncharacterized membrane protein
MDWNTTIVQPLLRWLHVIAGITWIGHLYFFNWVNGHLAKTYDAESKKKVVPELMPRALYFFRWGAAWTWLTGFLLLGAIYYSSTNLTPATGVDNTKAIVIALGLIIFVFFIYDTLWKVIKNEMAAAAVSFILILVYLYFGKSIFSGRALYIHLGALFGTIMMMNVWMRIWPAQKKIIAGIKGTGPAPDAAVPAMAGLRSKHNTYMSVPLVFMMISNHYPTITDAVGDMGWVYAACLVLLGWLLTKWLYIKSASPAALDIGDKKAQ